MTPLARAAAFIAEAAMKSEPFLLYLPLTAPHTPLSVIEAWKNKSGFNDYADFVMQTDHAIGQVLDAIDAAGQAENTLVIVTSDNGCSPQADYPALLALSIKPGARWGANGSSFACTKKAGPDGAGGRLFR